MLTGSGLAGEGDHSIVLQLDADKGERLTRCGLSERTTSPLSCSWTRTKGVRLTWSRLLGEGDLSIVLGEDADWVWFIREVEGDRQKDGGNEI